MTLSNAGHLPPLIRHADGSVERLEAQGGSPLGILAGMQFGQEARRLVAGDTIVLYTDGDHRGYEQQR